MADIAVHRVHRALAPGAPEQRVDRPFDGRSDTVGRTSQGRDRIGEYRCLGVDQHGQRIVLPERIDLGDIGNVETGRLEAEEIGDDLHPVQQRVNIPVNVPFGAVLAGPAQLVGGRLVPPADIEPGLDRDAAQVGEAPRLGCHIDEPHGLPKADRDTDPGNGRAAQAHRKRGVVVGVGAARDTRPDMSSAHRQREQAAPAHIGDRIDELAGARAGRARARRRARPQYHKGNDQAERPPAVHNGGHKRHSSVSPRAKQRSMSQRSSRRIFR